MKHQPTKIFTYLRFLLFSFIAGYFFFIPSIIVIQNLTDPNLTNGQIPQFAIKRHQTLSQDFASWASERVATGQAATLSINNISGTEWPIFSAVYYLWATESIQDEWLKNPSLSEEAPTVYAKRAIEASAALIADPNHANWVKLHWGDDYLERENLFYRMLLISGLTSYQKLTGNTQYEPLLISQVKGLSAELDQSPYGLLDDYPGQCYPIDIVPAIAAIQRAGSTLNQDYDAFVLRSIRGFEGRSVDPSTGLPTYICNPDTGQGIGPSRGIGASYILIWSPELWPERTEQWYQIFEQQYWQTGRFLRGIREFSNKASYPNWLVDVDAGPVMAGYGTAATAFGIGASRVNGRLDMATPLTQEMIVALWPLPTGTWLGPRMLSNLSDAPYLGETALLFILTRQPITEVTAVTDQNPPGVVYIALLFYFGGTIFWGWLAYRQWKRIVNKPRRI